MTATPDSRLAYALRYAAAGFAVFPLHWIVDAGDTRRCNCRDTDCRSKGKHPMTPNGVKDATTDPAQLTTWWTQWPEANIGMAMGGPMRLCTVDTDPRNGGDVTLAELIDKHGPLPDTAMALTGGGGTHHLFTVPDGVKLPGKIGTGIDLKGEGGYIVVEPSRHESGVTYAWEASSDPLDGQAIAPLPAWIQTAKEAASAPAAPTVRAVGIIPPQQAIELRSAMAFLDVDDRETWLQVGMALHSTGAANAYGLWVEWSQLSTKFRADDQRRVWASFTSTGGIHVESIFAMATRAGWVNPASAEAVRFSESVEQAIAAANSRTQVELIEPDATEPTGTTLPVPVLEAAAQWMDQRYALTHPAVSRQAVLALAALGSSRVYIGDGGTPAHLCLGIVAESSILTAYARDAISRVLDDAGLRRMMRGTRTNSPSNVYSTLFRSPAAIHIVADYGHLAQFAKRQPSGVLDQAFCVMADAYASSTIYIDSAVEAGLKPSATDDQLVVHSPSLTTLLLSTHEQMGTLLQRNELTRGLMAYQLPVIVDTAGAVESEASNAPVPPQLRDTLRAVRRLQNHPGDLSMQDIFGQQPCLRPNLVRVRFAVDCREHAAAINAVSAEPAHRPLVLAAQETARRLAVALAPWRDPQTPVATRDLIDWCTGYVIRHLHAWLEQYSTLGNEDGKTDVGQKVVSVITARRSAGLPRAHVAMYCRPFRLIRDKEKRDRLLDLLIEDGDLVEVTPPGKRQKVLVAGRYVRHLQVVK